MPQLRSFKDAICAGIPQMLPEHPGYDPELSHAPKRNISHLTIPQKQLAVENALRYFPPSQHKVLAREFADELEQHGRIYMYRFRPQYPMRAQSIDAYPCRSKHAAAIMLMIQNNLDPLVAKHPHELITYGGNGAVFQNWAQYLLTMQYLSQMTDEQTLVMYSGHPLGLFPSHRDAPRVVVTNGMMVPNYSSKEDWNTFNALGVTQYGQMTAGSYMYIGPQGIVHGTTITLLNAGRLMGYGKEGLRGKLFVTSGLGGMSGAQALAAVITGVTAIVAEVDGHAIRQRISDHYIREEHVYTDLKALTAAAQAHRTAGLAVSLVYHGNVVDLLEALVRENIKVDLGSDQTSLHNIEGLGYCPVGYSYAEAQQLLNTDQGKFLDAVRASLRRHVEAINHLSERGMFFWDYGNAFLKEAGEAGADIWKNASELIFRYPSYVENIMGPMCFDFGFGPFRWVCTSGTEADLRETDEIALRVLRAQRTGASEEIIGQLDDNISWIEQAEENIPVVGSKARILYADANGRIEIAKALNAAIRSGQITAPVVLGRDHHDVSGTDSPYRETANIYDGSRYTADMAIQNVIGDSFRGATWVSIHNGGGTGWGEAINGGFGMVLDGSDDADRRLQSMLHWDVNNGIARRSWARNTGAMHTAEAAMAQESRLKITVPHLCEKHILDGLFGNTE